MEFSLTSHRVITVLLNKGHDNTRQGRLHPLGKARRFYLLFSFSSVFTSQRPIACCSPMWACSFFLFFFLPSRGQGRSFIKLSEPNRFSLSATGRNNALPPSFFCSFSYPSWTRFAHYLELRTRSLRLWQILSQKCLHQHKKILARLVILTFVEQTHS